MEKDRILVVDDEPVNIFLLKSILEEDGFEVITAQNGNEAINLSFEMIPDAILLDLMMPGVSGIEVLDTLINNENTKDISIIVVTAKSESSDLKIALEKGAMDYIKKPIDEIELMARLKSALLLMKRKKELDKANKELERKNGKMLKELAMAKRVQENLIPKEKDFPKRTEFSFGSKYLSMESLGGDIYDVINIDNNNYAFLIADVSGHGVSAALVTTMVKMSFNSYAHQNLSPADVCNRVNKEMFELVGEIGYFVTACYGLLNVETGEFKYSNAGHPPAILYHIKNREVTKLDTDGFALGVFSDIVYEDKLIKLRKNDKIIFFTDGIIEVSGKKGKYYGYDRVMEYVSNNGHLPSKALVEGLIDDVDDFSGNEKPLDDRAILCIEIDSDFKAPIHLKTNFFKYETSNGNILR